MQTISHFLDRSLAHAKALLPGLRRAIATWRWRRLAVISIVFWVPMILFLTIADEVLERERIGVDFVLLEYLRSIGSPTLDAVVAAFTDLGGVSGITILTLGLLAILLVNRRFKGIVFTLATTAGTVIINLLLKGFFQRGRPSLWESIVTETSFSFPSGHAMASATLALTVGILAWRYAPKALRLPVVIIAVIYTVLIGLSRNYLGVHFPSDVVGGWCISLAWVIVVYLALFSRRLKIEKPRKAAS